LRGAKGAVFLSDEGSGVEVDLGATGCRTTVSELAAQLGPTRVRCCDGARGRHTRRHCLGQFRAGSSEETLCFRSVRQARDVGDFIVNRFTEL
jgi:hypothetical protein